ncbi:hypothetical protein KR018_010567 [Drosophila ironensis]|nr:hypothetical protein KR018_010567 [Drosophila ironensis]
MDCQSSKMSVTEESSTTRKECGKRGRKPGRKTSTEKLDIKAKLERSRQSARECRARKKLRYQYLEELVADREKAVVALRAELERVGIAAATARSTNLFILPSVAVNSME